MSETGEFIGPSPLCPCELHTPVTKVKEPCTSTIQETCTSLPDNALTKRRNVTEGTRIQLEMYVLKLNLDPDDPQGYPRPSRV